MLNNGHTNEDQGSTMNTRRKIGRTPTACVACRASKLRCDKKVPCGRCVLRGIGALCPNESNVNEKRTRLPGSSKAGKLHDRLEQLNGRKQELEDALQALQQSVASTSVLPPEKPQMNDSPPTTIPAHLQNILKVPQEVNPPSQSADVDCSLADIFGTLTLGSHGESTFFGKTARVEYLISALAPGTHGTHGPSKWTREPPFEGTQEEIGQNIFRMLPLLYEAIDLCEVYQEHGKYMYIPISQEELFEEILMPIYHAKSFEGVHCHALALLLIIFALGTLLDADRQSHSTQAQKYYHMARTVLAFEPQTTSWSVAAFLHTALYLFFCDGDCMDSNSPWIFMGHAVRLGYSIGLHLDGNRWKLPQKEVERRRRLFWQLFMIDTWISLSFGRPSSMSFDYIDPLLPRKTVDADRKSGNDFHDWNLQYTVLLCSIMHTVFGAKLPAYSTIISLDRNVREFPVPAHLRLFGDGTEARPPVVPPELDMQRWVITSRKEMTLLHLHRPFFTKALQELPADLANHRYIPSVVAIYRSAWRIIEGLRLAWKRVPQALLRFNPAWSQGLSAAIVLCLLITRAPTSNMTSRALEEIDLVLELFREVAPLSMGVTFFVNSVQKLHDKAHEAVSHLPSHNPTPLTPSELDRLNGKTHLVVVDADPEGAHDNGPSDSVTHTYTLTQVSEKQQSIEHYFGMDKNYLHPIITQDMRSFGMEASTFDTSFFDFPMTSSLPLPQMPHSHWSGINPHAMNESIFPHPTMNIGFEQQQNETAIYSDVTWDSLLGQLGL